MYNYQLKSSYKFGFIYSLLLAASLSIFPAISVSAENQKALTPKKVPTPEQPKVTKPDPDIDLVWLQQVVGLLSPKLTQAVISFGFSPARVTFPDILANFQDVAGKMSEELASTDPLDSPHPVPWNWVLSTQAQVNATDKIGVRYYRTPSLISPDGKYAAYSRVQMYVKPELHSSRVISTLFVENLQTGELETIVSATRSHDSETIAKELEDSNAGQIAILIPVSWSPKGDRLLSRQFEGFFSTSDAYDIALVWDRRTNKTTSITPQEEGYESTVLLGWSQQHPGRVLFQTSNLEDDVAPMWAVDLKGDTVDATSDRPVILGTIFKPLWSGAQLDK
jgi:hypothetical protein